MADPASQRVLLTGGSSGVGFEAAKVLSAQGHELTILCRNQATADQTLSQLSGSARSVICDLADLVSGGGEVPAAVIDGPAAQVGVVPLVGGIGVLRDLVPIGPAVVVGVGVFGIGAEGGFLRVGEAVLVGVDVARDPSPPRGTGGVRAGLARSSR